MSAAAVGCAVPATSALAHRVGTADFHDAYAVDVGSSTLTALEHFLVIVRRTPRWVDVLMTLRNRMVRMVGLKDLGALGGVRTGKPAAAYRPGDRVGIFTLISATDDEVLLGDSDRHLDVTLSVLREPLDGHGQRRLVVSTVVQVHNLLGRIYMLPVAPLHRLIAPAVLGRAAGL
ncbi:DUF2867 domain-containing protein [Aquincola tertiaricarbonis]|uniref:DUF2867 domain-containing protein n=1 Tax=Aquincola tertiaricarbonis TaxID=391953 RepID=UPI000698E125|nr:DUF2867 domain-containing protein [Aquincola tertiaricarbonis]